MGDHGRAESEFFRAVPIAGERPAAGARDRSDPRRMLRILAPQHLGCWKAHLGALRASSTCAPCIPTRRLRRPGASPRKSTYDLHARNRAVRPDADAELRGGELV